MFNRLTNLILKEFYSLFQDKQSRMQLLMMPIVMLFIFSFAMTMEVRNSALGVLNEDAGDLGRRFVAMFASGPTFSRVFNLEGNADIQRAVDTQKALMVLHIPKDFSQNLISGQSVTVQTILDGRKSNAAQIVNGYASLIAQQFAGEIYAGRMSTAGAADIEMRYLFNPNLEFSWFNLPMLLILLTQIVVLLITGLSVAKERELGTFEQLLVSPLSPIEIVVGKSVPGVFIGFLEGFVIYAISITFFGVPFVGSLPLLAWAMFLFILATSGVGLFISSLCETQQQAFLGTSLFMVPSMLLSGFIAPVENMPSFLRWLSQLNPTMHTLKVVIGIYLKDLQFFDIDTEIYWLTFIAVCSLLLASWFFKKKTQ